MEEKECRVCREDEDTVENPLYAPCLCSGSILYCHESCLVEWLKRSGKDHCELCKTKYEFKPKYAPHTPEFLSRNEVIVGLLRIFATKLLPNAFRFLVALMIWLVFMPCVTSTLYRSLVFTYLPTQPVDHSNISVRNNTDDAESTSNSLENYVYKNTVGGLLLTGLIVVSFIIAMSFGDFLRTYWTITNNNREQRQEQPPQPQIQQMRHQEEQPRPRQEPQAPEQPDGTILRMRADVARRHDRLRQHSRGRQNTTRNDIRQAENEPKNISPVSSDVFLAAGDEHNVERQDQKYQATFSQKVISRKYYLDDDLIDEINSSESFPHDNLEGRNILAEKPSIGTHHICQDELKIGAASNSDVAEYHHMSNVKIGHDIFESTAKSSIENGTMHESEQLQDIALRSKFVARRDAVFEDISHSHMSDKAHSMNLCNEDLVEDATKKILIDVDRFCDLDNARSSSDICDDYSSFSTVSENREDEEESDNEKEEEENNETGEELEDDRNRIEVENDDVGPINGILHALGLNELQMELEMEMQMDLDGDVRAGGLLVEDEVQEEERLRMLQAEEQRQEQIRRHHEELQMYDMWMRQEQEVQEGGEGLVNDVDEEERILPPLVEPPPLQPDPGLDGAELRAGEDVGRHGAVENGLEVRLNLGEVMGLMGPASTVLRSVAWMLLFNASCILVGYSIPSFFGYVLARGSTPAILQFATVADHFIYLFTIGRWDNFAELWKHILEYVLRITKWFGMDNILLVVKAQFLQFLQRAAETPNLIKIPDLLIIGTGYLVFISHAFFLYVVASILGKHFTSRGRTRRLSRKFSFFLDCAKVVTDIVKIAVLLGVRIFVLPCVVGIFIFQCWNSIIFSFGWDELVEFCINNIVGSTSVLWGLGISFMLYSTIAILQLREILHPFFLARYIRPQESQSDLLISLLNDSTPVQAKRLVTSSLVYILLIGAFVYLPLRCCQGASSTLLDFCTFWGASCGRVGDFVVDVLQVRTHYFAPELQIPLEVGLMHTTFLMFLEKFKDVIGACEYHTLLYLSKKLHLNRFLLPYTYKKIAPLSNEVKCLNDLAPAMRKLYHEREVLAVDGMLVAVCSEPLMRPPAGWDARVRESKTRWAWNDDTVFPLEKSVLPNIVPSEQCSPNERDGMCMSNKASNFESSFLKFIRRWGKIFMNNPKFTLRLMILVVVCWLLSVVASIIPALLPFIIGRTIFFSLGLPSFYCHDPLAYFIGNFVMQQAIHHGTDIMQRSMYGRLCVLICNWWSQRYLPPSHNEDLATSRSRESTAVMKRTVWGLARESILSICFGLFFLPLFLGLAYRACLMLQPLQIMTALKTWLYFDESDTCWLLSDNNSSINPVIWLTDYVMNVRHSSDEVAGLFFKELLRTVLFGQLLLIVFVLLVLSRRLKSIFATVGISVLRSEVEGPLSPAEEYEEKNKRTKRSRHWLMRWYVMLYGESSFVDLVRLFEWEVDFTAAAFVRCSPGTVMQDHLVSPKNVRTRVTTFEPALLIHHSAEILRHLNNAFLFAPHTCWLVQYVFGSYCLGLLLPLLVRKCFGWSSYLLVLEIRLLLPILMIYALWSWLNNVVDVGRHVSRGWMRFVGKVQKAIKDEYYLIGTQLQNSAEGLKQMASLQGAVASASS